MFMTDEGFASVEQYGGKTRDQVGREIIVSYQYRQLCIKLALVGSDGVVRALNDLI